MERIINLPNPEAIKEFVSGAREADETVLVSREGFKFQIDGASILGMMAVIGQNIHVKCLGHDNTFDRIIGIMDRYAIAK